MQQLLNKVNELLKVNDMAIQPKKSLNIANFECGTFKISDKNNVDVTITKSPRVSTFKYLGALFTLNNRGIDINEVTEDLNNAIEKMKRKRISVGNARYIFNNVLTPKIYHRLSGAVFPSSKLEEVDKIFRNYICY